MSGIRIPSVLLLFVALMASSLFGCGEGGEGVRLELEETGSIEPGDIQDIYHAGLAYDPFIVEATLMSTLEAEVTADGFSPMLKLIEVHTGAVLAEWDSEHSEDDALTYIIAADGEYEVRVYALDSGTGNYTVSISVDP